MGGFIYVCIALYLVYYFILRDKKPGTGSIKAAPLVIQPIASSTQSFNLMPYTVDIPPMPATKDSWLSISDDTDTLTSYAEDLDRHSQRIENAANTAITRFEQDYGKLKDQQLQIYRRIYQCRKLLVRFPELKQHKISASDIPEEFRVKLPRKPSYLSPKTIEKKYSVPVKGIVNAASKLAIANGGVRNAKNLLFVAGAMAAIALKGKANVSKLKRMLESSRGNILNYSTSLKTTVAMLNEAHTELVILSGKLKQSETGLIDIINKVGTIDPKITRLEQVPPDIRKHLSTLYFLTLEAEGYSKNRI